MTEEQKRLCEAIGKVEMFCTALCGLPDPEQAGSETISDAERWLRLLREELAKLEA